MTSCSAFLSDLRVFIRFLSSPYIADLIPSSSLWLLKSGLVLAGMSLKCCGSHRTVEPGLWICPVPMGSGVFVSLNLVILVRFPWTLEVFVMKYCKLLEGIQRSGFLILPDYLQSFWSPKCLVVLQSPESQRLQAVDWSCSWTPKIQSLPLTAKAIFLGQGRYFSIVVVRGAMLLSFVP